MGPGDNNIKIILGSDDDLRKALEASLGEPIMTISEFAEDCNNHEIGDKSDITVTIEGDLGGHSCQTNIPDDSDDLPW